MNPIKTERFMCDVCKKLYNTYIDAEECCSVGKKKEEALEEGHLCAECLKPLTDEQKAEEGFIYVEWERRSRYSDDEGSMEKAFFHVNCANINMLRKKAVSIY